MVIDDSEIRRVVGGGAYARGAAYAEGGRVLDRRHDDDGASLSGTVLGSGRAVYRTSVQLRATASGAVRILSTSCTCPVGSGCKHAAALLLHDRSHEATPPESLVPDSLVSDSLFPDTLTRPGSTRDGTVLGGLTSAPGARAPQTTAQTVPAWQRALDRALSQEPATRRGVPLGLQLELQPTTDDSSRGGSQPYRVAVRPVIPSARGRWVRTGISWSDVAGGYSHRLDDRHLAAVSALYAILAANGRAHYVSYYVQDPWMSLDAATSRALWDVLGDVRRAGVALVHPGADPAPVTLLDEPATVLVDLRRDERGITLAPSVLVDGEPLAPGRRGLIGGDEPTGVYWWSAQDDQGLDPKTRRLTLARFAEPLSPEVSALLRAGRAVDVPAAQTSTFLSEYYPRLAARMPVSSRDGSVELPSPPAPVLQLTVRVGEVHVLDLDWAWEYRGDDGTTVERVGLRRGPDERWARASSTEARILADATAAVALPDGPAAAAGLLAEHSHLGPWETVEFVTSALPVLRTLPDVEVVVVGELADYRQAQGEPQVAVATTSADAPATATTHATAARSTTGGHLEDPGPVKRDRDWFDLAVTVHVDEQAVPLSPLLVALAAGDERMLLPDGLWLRIDTPALAGLRALIAEARAMQDSPAGPLQISRFQAGIWTELEALGVVVAQAEAWQRAVADVRGLESSAIDVPVPAAVRADLRSYQRDGFAWLTRLYDAELGGVLADDMGLGKTLQVLALAARLRLDGPAAAQAQQAPPLLVVAPTSVVGNWAVEAAKFVPDLRVRTIDRTRAKRGTELADLAADADVIVTSYALFRLEYDAYAALGWSVLVLDEAQMVKNHESRTYACAKKLPARVKIAITGTPLENTVMELWALLGIVAPGLFPSPKRFTEFYRTPIERDGNDARLALLRRRIRPLVLRRTKEEVASDLPPRLEHVVDVELAPRHRAVYDRHLHRERQKVLGLLADFDGNRFEIFRSLMLLRRLALDPSLVDATHATVPASKLDVLDSMLDEIVADGHRVLVFSQFTGVLDRVRTRLDARGTEHCYLDGTTRRRAQVIERFRSGDAPVFLISLKAGGFGLTLTEADYVIVLDPWWNPAVEAQAVDRVHRIGQTRTVMVYRLVATGTIEEKVMALKEGKSRLFDSVMGGGELADARLSAADVRALLE